MNRVTWAVIKREYLQRVRTKWFFIATVGAPLLAILLLILPTLGMGNDDHDRSLTLVDRTGVLAPALAPRLEDGGYAVTVLDDPQDETALGALESSVRRERLGGYMILDGETLRTGRVTLASSSAPSPVRAALLRQAVVQAALEVRLGGDRSEVDTLLGGGALDISVLSSEGPRADEPGFIAAYVGGFLLYMVLLFYAVAVMRSVLEEKTSRMVEVVLSCMRPFDLMLGKIVGVGAVGLTQLAIWLALGIVAATAGLPALVAARPDLLSPSTLATALPGAGYLVLFGVFFLGGYFIYSGLYAAVGATCSTEEEAQQAQFPVVMLLVVPMIFIAPVIQDPDSTLAVVLSLIPFFTPVLMFARAVVGGASPVEVGASIVLMAVAVVAVAWLAGRIYRVGILMTGKRATLPEIVRWIRRA